MQCVYLIDGQCSIYARRPHVCRSFDCRMFGLLPGNEGIDRMGWSPSPERTCAERLRDTAVAKFPFVMKSPDDDLFAKRFWPVFLECLNDLAATYDLSAILQQTLQALASPATLRRIAATYRRDAKQTSTREK